MLKRLAVQNFALIENVELTFDKGFTVLTGETGSGKSILLGALRLILGERADYVVIRDAEKKTVVETTFLVNGLDLADFFEANDLDYADETIIRREIHAQGKSRSFINDTPVQLSVLKELTAQLIHIHSQHHTLNLKDKSFQLALLDTLIDADTLRRKVGETYREWKQKEKVLQLYKEEIALALRENDFNQFQLDELRQLELHANEFVKLEEEVNRGEQSEEIKMSYGKLFATLQEEGGIIDQLTGLAKLPTFGDTTLDELVNRLASVRIELQDISSVAEDGMEVEISSPEELQRKSDLLDAYNSALRKHGLFTQEELIQLQEKLEDSVSNVENADAEVAQREKEVKALEKSFLELARELSKYRKEKTAALEAEICSYLREVKLVDAIIRFDLFDAPASKTGTDGIAMLFSANKGMAPQPIEKSASGGELSRLMLVLQHLLSKKQQLPTVIFDEIDTGVSGEVAQRIGALLQNMGKNMQLLAITHLPQVAGKGKDHLKVIKRSTDNGKTITELIYLSGEERVEEVARLMSGSQINDAALENAKNLMNE